MEQIFSIKQNEITSNKYCNDNTKRKISIQNDYDWFISIIIKNANGKESNEILHKQEGFYYYDINENDQVFIRCENFNGEINIKALLS